MFFLFILLIVDQSFCEKQTESQAESVIWTVIYFQSPDQPFHPQMYVNW